MYVRYRLVRLSSGIIGPHVGTAPSLRGLSLPGPVTSLITLLFLFVVLLNFLILNMRWVHQCSFCTVVEVRMAQECFISLKYSVSVC